MSQLMMDEPKEEGMIDNEDEPQEEVEEEFIIDTGMMDHMMPLGFEAEEEVLGEEEDGFEYGGMDPHLYDAIVEFKRNGLYPDIADQRIDRSAHCHWRLRCGRFAMHEDGCTLLYGGDNVPLEQKKFVIKKGEVKHMIDRVHSLIGHVGTKRTQAALQKKMYWRSVRNDVMQFVSSCDYCQEKKAHGKKLSKAPIDIQSESFGLDITVEYTDIPNHRIITIRLEGFDEEYVHAAAQSRMTTYTFRSTESEHRKAYRQPQFFKRQPYLRRPRFNQGTQSTFLVPILNRGAREPRYMSLPTSRIEEMEGMRRNDKKYIDNDSPVDDDEQLTPVDPTVASTSRTPSAASERPATADNTASAAGPPATRLTTATSRHRAYKQAKVYDMNHPAYRRSKMERMGKEARQARRDEHGAMRGAAPRFSGIMIPQNGARGDRHSSSPAVAAAAVERHILFAQHQGIVGNDVITPYDEARFRAELAPLPPVLLIPSNDPEVAELQKELLTRQLEIQKLQMRALQDHLEGTARYEEVDGRDDVEELNVIDTEY